MRRIFPVFSLICVFFLLSSFGSLNDSKYYVRTVVIDAGHGGHDPGCQYAKVQEKQIALNVALKLGKIIQENIEDVKVVYTRDKDEFIELNERSALANRHNADVFISIHVNSAASKSAIGTETYAMGLHKSDGNLDVAKRENSVILMEEDYSTKYDGFDPNSPEAHIIFSLYQNAYLNQSLNLASKIEQQFSERVNRHSRGVKQAGFIVLWKATMPSVLVETGFITNDNDRKFLETDLGQVYMASAIYRAFKDYKAEMEASDN
ncbi:MAG: N-acetylmuramoyl-L-alanine amidase [Bacteroidia bacterium]